MVTESLGNGITARKDLITRGIFYRNFSYQVKYMILKWNIK